MVPEALGRVSASPWEQKRGQPQPTWPFRLPRGLTVGSAEAVGHKGQGFVVADRGASKSWGGTVTDGSTLGRESHRAPWATLGIL